MNATEPAGVRANPTPERATLTGPEVAAMLGVSEAHVRRHPPVPPIVSGRRVLYPRAAVLAVLNGEATPAGVRVAAGFSGGSPVRTAAVC